MAYMERKYTCTIHHLTPYLTPSQQYILHTQPTGTAFPPPALILPLDLGNLLNDVLVEHAETARVFELYKTMVSWRLQKRGYEHVLERSYKMLGEGEGDDWVIEYRPLPILIEAMRTRGHQILVEKLETYIRVFAEFDTAYNKLRTAMDQRMEYQEFVFQEQLNVAAAHVTAHALEFHEYFSATSANGLKPFMEVYPLLKKSKQLPNSDQLMDRFTELQCVTSLHEMLFVTYTL